MTGSPITMRADDLLVETIEGLLGNECTPERIHAAENAHDAKLWSLLADSGLTAVGRPEQSGGSGGTLHDLAAIVKSAGRHAAAVPLADTLIGATLLGEIAVPDGPLAIAIVRDGRSTVRVPWAPVATHVVAVSANGVALLEPSSLTPTRSGANYAGEPWHEYASADLTRNAKPNGVAIDDAMGAAAFGRAMLLAGALEQAVDLTLQYANEREQFGKPIGKFQIIQHYLAEMAGEAAAANAAVDNATDVIALSVAYSTADRAEHRVVIGAAKAYCGRAVGTITRLAHQIHGAIGYTDEHRLQYTTRRLWAWRDEFGSEAEWATVVGRSFTEPGSDVWARATAWPPAAG